VPTEHDVSSGPRRGNRPVCFAAAIASRARPRQPPQIGRASPTPNRYRLGAFLLVLTASLASTAFSGAAALGRTAPEPDGGARTPAERKAHSLFPRFAGAVPVLLYHRLVTADKGSGVAPATFEAQLHRLHDLGFDAITLDQYARFVRGDLVELPQRPVLITFDDG